MRIRNQDIDQFLNISIPMDFRTDLGREDVLKEFDKETLKDVINPIENYETSRFIHEPYSGITNNGNDKQCDIWYEFFFYNNNVTPSHIGGLDYNLVGIDDKENTKMLKQSTKSFFRLEFYKTPENEEPERSNRRLVFAKNLSLPTGERVLKIINSDNNDLVDDYDMIYVPVFMGSNFKNKENMYLFWFQDESALTETILTGGTFFMTARFFNADDGSIINFANKSLGISDEVNENFDLYYKVVINKDDYTYKVFTHDDSSENRIGTSGNPIRFYEITIAPQNE